MMMVNDKAPVRASVVVLLALSAVAGAGTSLVLYSFLVEYGPTTGSAIDGAREGLTLAAVPLLLVVALAAIAFTRERRSAWLRGLAVAVVALSVCGALASGAQAAVVKYDRLPTVPACDANELGQGARAAQDAFAALEHPGRFGGGWSSIRGCGADLLNVTFADAAAHYRVRLSAAGWNITRDDASAVTASRDDLVFVLIERCGPISVDVTLAEGVRGPTPC